MAKKAENEVKTAPVRIDAGIAKKAKIAAEHQGIDVSDYLSRLLKVPVEKDWGRARKAILDS
jgi:predicted HicB family RNase H-like nuclease